MPQESGPFFSPNQHHQAYKRCPVTNGRTLMGYASYFEDIQERANNNRVMFGVQEERLRPKTVYVARSPSLQPTIAPMTPTVPAAADSETVARRVRALHEKHVLAIYELMPGKNWRK
jgi:hypothetical protein